MVSRIRDGRLRVWFPVRERHCFVLQDMQSSSGPILPPVQGVQGLCPGVKPPGCEDGLSHSCCAEV